MWKWSSLWAWESESSRTRLAPWPIPRPALWLQHVNQPQGEAELASVRRSIVRSRPYGDKDWTVRTAKSLGLEHALRVPGRAPG
jgi:hypothetical protein